MTSSAVPVVLLVEDEPMIRLATAEALLIGGFTVLEAQDAEEALTIVNGGGHIDLVFTDVNLPGDLDGIQLSRMVEEYRPGTGLVVTSGRPPVNGADLPHAAIFLPKPYRATQLCHVIRGLLAR